jgi:hypothetical protein
MNLRRARYSYNPDPLKVAEGTRHDLAAAIAVLDQALDSTKAILDIRDRSLLSLPAQTILALRIQAEACKYSAEEILKDLEEISRDTGQAEDTGSA